MDTQKPSQLRKNKSQRNKLQEKIYFRQQVNLYLREFLNIKKYLEVDVPVLAPSLIPESYVEVFQTELKTLTGKKQTGYLTTSPEPYLKRLLVNNSGSIFYLGKAFRNNEPIGSHHNHEFTILEWYHAGFNYQKLMTEIEEMFDFLIRKLNIKNKFNWESPWERLTIQEAQTKFVKYQKNKNLNLPNDFEKNYVQYIEPNLGTRGTPTFITDFPTWQTPLARSKKVATSSRKVAERFELYINGIELINGCTELNDWELLQKNLEDEQKERKKMNKTRVIPDLGFIKALKKGMPECAGAAMGVDRLLMVLGGYKKLEEVVLFPTKKLFE